MVLFRSTTPMVRTAMLWASQWVGVIALTVALTLSTWAAAPVKTTAAAQAKPAPIAEPTFEAPPLASEPKTTPQQPVHTTPQSAQYAIDTHLSAPMPPADVKTKTITQTVYEPLAAMLVLAIPSPTLGKKGFSDAAWRVGTELAHQMEIKHPATTIHYPTQTIARLEKNNPHLLRTVWRQWAENGSVSPVALNHLLDAVSDEPIARVVFVQADVDFNQPEKSWRPVDFYKKHLGGHIPDDARSYLRSTVSVINTQEPDQPLVWRGSWQHPIKNKEFGNVTASVYQDTDSIKAIGDASAMISQVLLVRAPKAAFTKPITVTTTQVVAKKASQP